MSKTIESRPRRYLFLGLVAAFILGGVLMIGIGALLVNITERQAEGRVPLAQISAIPENELDPAVWGVNFPSEYDSFLKMQDDTVSTAYGGSKPINKLERFPQLVQLWAGYAFSVDFNEERGHYYALIDQKKTKRQEVVKQPGACANCHSAEAPQLIAAMGWETFNHTPYAELSDKLHTGTSCADCHDPKTMSLRITRPAFVNAMSVRGIDVTKATRQEMRTYVCAQCHVEYYFAGDNKVLTFPWKNGTSIDDIDKYYEEINFKDWTHKEAEAPMIKIQHPEFEMYTSSLHYKSGVSCADCHMPYVREGSRKVTDHWIRSPITHVNDSCQTCHKQDEQALLDRISTIQNKTAELSRTTEKALLDAMEAIKAAKAAGATDDQLKDARWLYRRAQMRWDFVFSENSTGFHSPQESARVLANAIDLARQAQLGAVKVTPSTQPARTSTD
ncbi:MAG: ammonia-forming cytochrome c nitrite reductase subunit c552 [Anaerolineae bacterium]|nr:ammonia-forming cytochrome c nitrite reductase subunit c552 [Anaerolineae bacterium]